MKNSLSGAAIASAIISLLATQALAADPAPPKKHDKEPAKVRCGGVNECKGKGECGGASSSCAGTNGCKGKGWVFRASAKECTSKGGTVL